MSRNGSMELSINNRSEYMVLPVNPAEIVFTTGNSNAKVTLLNAGEITLPGNRTAVTFSVSSFFPAEGSPFYRYSGKPPQACVDTLLRWKELKTPIRFISGKINMAVLIDSFTYTRRESTQDMDYSLSFSEYRDYNVAQIQSSTLPESNGLKARPDDSKKAVSYTVKSGDTLWGIAVKVYGDGAKYKTLVEKNKTVIGSMGNIYAGQVLRI